MPISFLKDSDDTGSLTCRLAAAWLPVTRTPKAVAVTSLVVFSFKPAVVPVTLTVKLQDSPAASETVASEILPDPATAVMGLGAIEKLPQ